MRRYDQLVEIARLFQPKTIIEIGVHEGHRARRMLEVCKASYLGFDVFETKDPTFHVEAYNGKGIPSEQKARNLLKDFDVEFIIGDTRETLHGKEFVADLVFIDGDHRVEVIKGDYEAVKGSKIVVFDDFYTGGPDITKVGCNLVVENLNYHLLPIKDPIIHGGYTQLCIV